MSEYHDPISRHTDFDDFPVGTKVRVVCTHQDFQFFNGGMDGPTGEVIRNEGRYLGIIVRFDEPRLFHKPGWSCTATLCHDRSHAYDHREHNFAPDDLIVAGETATVLRERPPDMWGARRQGDGR